MKEESVVCELMKLEIFELSDDFVMAEGFFYLQGRRNHQHFF